MSTPEEFARSNIDKLLTTCGWTIQDIFRLNRYAGLGVTEQEASCRDGIESKLEER